MERQDLKTNNHGVFRLFYHIGFQIKYRNPCITPEMARTLELSLTETAAKWECQVTEFGAEVDHIHFILDAHPSMNLARMIGNLKTVSSRRVRKEYENHLSQYFWKPYFWSRSYSVISVGGRASLETVIRYIQNQEPPAPHPLD